MTDARPSWLVFYGTLTTIARADNEQHAYETFLRDFGVPRFRRGKPQPPPQDRGRIMPPTRDEVHIRRPRESDREWLADSGSPQFIALLKEIPELARD